MLRRWTQSYTHSEIHKSTVDLGTIIAPLTNQILFSVQVKYRNIAIFLLQIKFSTNKMLRWGRTRWPSKKTLIYQLDSLFIYLGMVLWSYHSWRVWPRSLVQFQHNKSMNVQQYTYCDVSRYSFRIMAQSMCNLWWIIPQLVQQRVEDWHLPEEEVRFGLGTS